MHVAVPISTREPKRTVNQYVATNLKRTVALESTNQKPRHTTRKLYEHVSKTCSWWYPKFTPPGYKWKPKSQIGNVNLNLVEIILFIVDSGCSKHMTGNLKLLTNFVEKFLGTVKFGNDQIAPILGYGDLVQGFSWHKLVFHHSSRHIFSKPICLMAKATSSQAWLWHRRLSHLNFDTINLLSKNDIMIGLPKVKFVKDHLCSSWIEHQMSVARTPEKNGVVERWNCTLVEAARTMLSAAKVLLFFWAEAIATSCFTQNRSLCYIVRDGENLDKMKEKGDACIFVGYSTQSRAYKIFNKRTKVIVETIHVNFDELPHMASNHVSSDPVPQCRITVLEHDSLSPGPQCQENVPQTAKTVITLNELDLLFSLMFVELLNGSTQVVSKSSTISTADAPHQYHPLEQVIGSPSQSVRSRHQLKSDGEMCMFTLTVSQTEPKNIKKAMADSAWIESMQEELHQFDRLDAPLNEEVYVNQPDGFVDPYHPDKVYRLKKALHGLKQAPRAWYDELSKFLVSKGFSKGSIDPTLFITKHGEDTLLVQIYKDTGFELTSFSDSNHAGCLDSRKSTSGGIQFLGGDKLVSWSSKKQDCTSMSLAEPEYVSLSACCAQVLWLRTQLTDYGFHFDKIPMYCDSKAAIAISCKPVQDSCTKHIDVRYHFMKEKVEKGIVELFFVGTEYQLADLFTKALSEDRFKYLVRRLGMRCLTPEELEVLAHESA
uniref:Gag-Pol polyprotein n=1 Tax=Tanacetum cinerariifolium TaxID=118510 RepID=A0A6L2MK32_TANCI|nr:Gag-Pol polyprotein [Tanacetum cinerariifolium]